jgi:glycosyltransferase involved in cell wall biosynthesis
VGAHFQAAIPILIPTFNSVTYLKRMLSQLRGRGLRNVVVVDNASTFPPFLEYLSQIASEVTVIRMSDNRGPRDVFLDKKNFAALPQYFCVTDPDLEFNGCLPEDFLCELAALTGEHRVGKAGFALDLSDRRLMRQEEFQIGDARYRVWEWEAQFWKQEAGRTGTGDAVYFASIDTTFALYNKHYFDPVDHLRAVRVAGNYTCRHLPWYQDTGLPPEEEDYYRGHEKFSFYLKASDPAQC